MKSSNHWKKNTQEIIEIQKIWNTIGHAGKRDNNKLFKRFRSLCDNFFSLKREFSGQEKEVQENNLQLKQDLCVQAEAIMESAEWKATTDEFIQLQNKWKEIGSVPSKQSEAIWKRFRYACDHFFEQKAKHYSAVDSEYDNNLKTKQALIEQIKNFRHSKNPKESFEQLKDFQRQWSEIGFVPFKFMKKIQEEYRSAINKQFESLQMDDGERNRLQYKNKIETMVATSNSRTKLGPERDRLMRRFQQLQSDLVVWENNIGFFSKSKNSAAMVSSVQNMIEQGKAEMKELEAKIKIIDSVEDK
jgi:predicted XRE-type DNA-binding protein